MPPKEELHGWFSETSSKQHGYAIFKDAQGNDIRVTEITSKLSAAESALRRERWPDVQHLGRVESYVRTVVGPSIEFVFGARRMIERR